MSDPAGWSLTGPGAGLRRIDVSGPAPYPVEIGRSILGRVGDLLGEQVRRVLVVHPESVSDVAAAVGDGASTDGSADRVVLTEVIPDAEAAKTVEVAARLWGVLGRAEFTRSDAIVAVGGGSVTDLAGFVAATWLRGIRVVHVPTTLLGMVDAAVGGKTGINTAEGKNLVGAFHPPAGVVCDLATLRTLPQADLVAGLAEVVKTGWIADPDILDLVEREPTRACTWDSPVLADLIGRSVAVKAHVVGEDLRETFLREILNYGHTLAHAIELVEGFRWRHGEAVAVGMVYAAQLAVRSGHLDQDVAARHRSILESLGLPTTYRPGRWEALLTAMRRDKKNRGDAMRLVILDGVASPIRLTGPPVELLRQAYHDICG
ncbi:MAG TPA: 3-dehydroquinate synthase [Dermatophilaceae bacterium]|nr:3-dehydroquinate synthase [Dermatophilaceae bacterium]